VSARLEVSKAAAFALIEKAMAAVPIEKTL
jgi:hypothetical protein